MDEAERAAAVRAARVHDADITAAGETDAACLARMEAGHADWLAAWDAAQPSPRKSAPQSGGLVAAAEEPRRASR